MTTELSAALPDHGERVARGSASRIVVDRDGHLCVSAIGTGPAHLVRPSSQFISSMPAIAPQSSAKNESGQVTRADARKGVCQRPCDRDRRIGERCRGREPVGRRDVEADQPWHRRPLKADASQDRRNQPERQRRLRQTIAVLRSGPSSRNRAAAVRTSDARPSFPRCLRRSAAMM